MNTTVKQLRKLFLLICLITAGVQSAWGDNSHYYWPEGAFYDHDGKPAISDEPYSGALKFNYWNLVKTVISSVDAYESGYTVVNGVKYFYYYCDIRAFTKPYHYTGTNIYWNSYYKYSGAWITGFEGSPTIIVIPDHITVDGKDYRVYGMGYREYVEPDNKEFKTSSVSISNSSASVLVFKKEDHEQTVGLYGGNISFSNVQVAEFEQKCAIKNALNLPSVTSITFYDTPKFFANGKIKSTALKDIYFRCTLPTWEGEYADHFSAAVNTITAHVYDMTPNEIALMKTNPVWSNFKQIVNHKSKFSYSLNSDGNAKVSLYQLSGGSSYATAETTLVEAAESGSKTGTVKGPLNYAVVISDFDPSIKTATLKRNGTPVELQSRTVGGATEMYYNEPSLEEDVTYEAIITDKTCEFTLTQTGYKGNITYMKTLNGTTSSGMIYNQTGSFTCGRGTTLQLSIPYDQYMPLSLEMNETDIQMTLANGRATATIAVPTDGEAAATLTWQAPQQAYVYHVPLITILRSGDGDVLFEGLNNYVDPDNGTEADWHVVKSADCVEDLTVVTVPDADLEDDYDWGFRLVIKPAYGQTLRTLKMGYLDYDYDHHEEGKPYRTIMYWVDALTDPLLKLYCQYDETTGYTLEIRGEYDHGWGAGDFNLLVGMGPAESEVQTGQTFSFVRKGGRGDSWIYWENTDHDFYFGEGSSSKIIPNEQLTDMQMHIELADGETFHVYKDGEDITTQFQLNEGSDYWAELETKSASYTLLIDDAPDANPTWNILQGEGMTGTQVIVTRGDEDETTTLTESATTMKINDEGVETVTLKVPVGRVEQVVKYQVRLLTVGETTAMCLRSLGYGTSGSNRIYNEVKSGSPVLLSKVYETEEEAQQVVASLVATDATAEIVPSPTNQNVSNNLPIKVTRNGVDITSQMNFEDPLYATFEVPANTLTNATWEVSFDTSHRLTIMRTGGTQASNIQYKIYNNNVTAGIPMDYVTTIDLPPYGEQSDNLQMNIRVAENETFTVLRNGVDVTEMFNEGTEYYEMVYNDETRGNFDFNPYEAATWQIIIEDGSFMVNAYATNDAGVSIATMNSDGEIVNSSAHTGSHHKQIEKGNGVRIAFTPAKGDVLRVITYGQWGLQEFTEGDGYLTKETTNNRDVYTLMLPAEFVNSISKPLDIFAIFDKPDSDRYDVNRDGEINITDVTVLVNKILHP